MGSHALRKYDNLLRCTNVLIQGVEPEYLKTVVDQEKCRKKWQTAEQDNHIAKKYMTKHKAEQDTLEVKLKMARHQLDAEIKKRLKAEQIVDDMTRQLELIKELLLDKDTDKKSLMQSLYQFDHKEFPTPSVSENATSYSVDDSSLDLAESEYDSSRNDLLDETEGSLLGNKRTKRGRPSAPPLDPKSSDDSIEDVEYGKRMKIPEVVHANIDSQRYESMASIIPSQYTPPLRRVDQKFERPPRPGKRPPSKQHIREFFGSSTTHSESNDTDEPCDPDSPVPLKRTFTLTRARTYAKQPTQKPPEKTMSQFNTVSNLYPSFDGLGTPPKRLNNTLSTPSSSRKPLAHSFVTKIAVRMESCGPCEKKLRFGSNVLKCKECKAVCHPGCKDKIPIPCVPCKDTPGKKEGAIECYVDNKATLQVPELVIRCIAEIEKRGLTEQGIYRVPGMDKQVKELKEKFLRKKHPDTQKVEDIHVICGCLKDFLRGLREPLLTFSLHEPFVDAANASGEDCLSGMYQCVSELPKVNRTTLATVILHLQKVANSKETQMNVANLSKVFGPTLLGHRSANPTHIEMLQDTKNQPLVVAHLLEMPADYWQQFLNQPSTRSSKSISTPINVPPYNPDYKTPNTPESREAPKSLLGPLDPSSTSKNARKTYSGMTPRVVSKEGKRQRYFFNSPC